MVSKKSNRMPMLHTSCKKRHLWFSVVLMVVCLGSCNSSACEKGSCLPGTGNLLIGRESRLTASSTCGFKAQERYCIVTSLEEKKKCFWCDSRPRFSYSADLSHRIENVVPRTSTSHRKQSWWQSQNGIENVTIRLDLEAEFYFTYLYIKFKTFRPAAMLVERSFDFGKSWNVYRYFAYDCAKYYPHVPRTGSDNPAITYCDERYSAVTPITDGEVILTILPSQSEINPYSEEIQNLVKITNLRINFTKLHTLGDDLLDSRVEIQEKYYYAISQMVVGGSCSCYGHASRCIAQEGVQSKPNMVHGKCECTHNTKGLNCEKCDDFYNDVEWHPAAGKETHACKSCNCHNHTTSCHFDKSVFKLTGNISGGVCDDCQHNTMGRNCEQCKHFFYQDTTKHFSDPNICLPCDCDPTGSIDDGICDSRTDVLNDLLSGRCHCKTNVEGRRCDICKNGFWNFTEHNSLGCQQCSCHTHGTFDNQGCNKETGECTCKRNVIGRDCNQCLPEYWGLGESRDGCKPCECDPGGSYDNNCDVINGQCRCRANITGRTCNSPRQTFFAEPLDFMVYEAELAKCHGICETDIREPYHDGKEITWTGPGFIRATPGTFLEFEIDNIQTSMDYYPIIRYSPQVTTEYDRVRITIERLNETDLDGVCANVLPQDDTKDIVLPPGSESVTLPSPVCLESRKKYKVRMEFMRIGGASDVPSASILIDSLVLVPRIENIPFMHGSATAAQRRKEFEDNKCAETIYSIIKSNISDICKKYHYSIGVYIHDGAYPCNCDNTGSYSTLCDTNSGRCSCKPNVVGRQCDRCAPGTYGFSPEGCKACDCHSVGALDNFCDIHTGQCKCRSNTYGRVCDQCQPGSWNYPNCQRCMCHGYADTCDPQTGVCLSCRNYTVGAHCDRCLDGYYGDPRRGIDIPCRMCPCPGTSESGHSFAKRCFLDPATQVVVCDCEKGYTGLNCEKCEDNYYGNPEVAGGSCNHCDCSNNVDELAPGNCNAHTGECLRCLYNTGGSKCDSCKAGYYGDAISRNCIGCNCSILGTDPQLGECDKVTGQCVCDKITGQCPCLPNVTGQNCDECIKNHWKIASGIGCEPCACDKIGSESDQCNPYTGECVCKQGFGGRQCNECQRDYWGDPNIECFRCNCDIEGSEKSQCHHNNGSCICKPGIGGEKCNQCARGYVGSSPACTSCGECFDNWDIALNSLKDQTDKVIQDASEIMKTGASGSYTKEFETMEKKIADMKQSLKNTSMSSLQLEALDRIIENARSDLIPIEVINNATQRVGDISERIRLASIALSDLKTKTDNLNATAHELKNNATKLQEGNVEGALNLTRTAYEKSVLVKKQNVDTESIASDAERQCKRAEALTGRQATQFNQGLEENDKILQKLNDYVNELETQIPNLNQMICDKKGSPCDQLCGGAGCGFCGGLSCENGALTKSQNAMKFAKDAEKLINDKETKANEAFRGVKQAKEEADKSLNNASTALARAESAKAESLDALNETAAVIKKLKKFLNTPSTTPSDIKSLAEQALEKNIKLKPEQITELTQKINDTISSLTDIPAVIRDTADDLARAQSLKQKVDDAKSEAEDILAVAEQVVGALNQAESSQKSADAAIQAANENIYDAQKDLNMISGECEEAQKKANETSLNLNDIKDKLKKLQTLFLKNDKDASEVDEEMKVVTSEVEAIQKKTVILSNSYRNTTNNLDQRAANSAKVRSQALILLEKASQLSANATAKLKELTDSEVNFGDQENLLTNITDSLEEYITRMSENYSIIGERAEYYINCAN